VIIFRFSQDDTSTNGAFLIIHLNPGTGHYQLYRYVSYGYTLFLDSTVDFAASDVVVITDSGTCLTATVNAGALWTDIPIHWGLGGTGIGFRADNSSTGRVNEIKVETIP
jgi:hypothetical protein